MAEKFWNEIPNHFPFVKLDEIIVMPNHTNRIWKGSANPPRWMALFLSREVSKNGLIIDVVSALRKGVIGQ